MNIFLRSLPVIMSILLTTLAFSAEIHGTIYETTTGQPLGHTNLIIVNSEQGAAANAEGRFCLADLKPGRYTIEASHVGFESNKITVDLTEGANVQQDFYMRESIFQTQKVVVTATRNERIMQDVPIVTEVIDREEIQERGVDHVAGALEDRAGIMITGSASAGKNISINGIDGKHVLVLDDGLPIAGKINNRLDLSQLDVDDIDHIEIVKGPGSALYGTEAMGGVVNIITRDITPGLNMNADVKYGSGDQYNGHFGMSGGSLRLGYAIGVDYNQGGNEKNETAFDITDILNTGFNAKVKYDHPAVGKVTLKTQYRQDGLDYTSNDVYGIFTDYNSDSDRWNTSLGWKNRYRNVDIGVQGYVSDYHKDLTSEIRNKEILQYVPFPLPAVSKNLTDERLSGVKSDLHWHLSDQLKIDAGYDFSTDDYESDRTAGSRTRDQHGVYGQVQITPLSSWMILVGSRYDHFNGTGGFVSPRVSSKIDITSDLALRATWGRGFRMPSFTDLYIEYVLPYAGGLTILGNPDLDPEESTGSNVGLEYMWNKKILFSVMGFRNEFENLINQYYLAPRLYTYRNVEHAVYTGAEFQTRFYILHNLSTTLSYNYTDVDQELGSYTVTNIAPHTASIRLVYRLMNDRLSFMLRDQLWGDHKVQVYDEQRGQFLDELQTRSRYHLVDVSTQFRVTRLYSIRAGINNVNDLTDALYGPFIGRQAFVSFHIVK